MHVKTIVTGPFQGNAYLIWKEGESTAVMIDPGDEADRLIADITAKQLHLGTILATHAHLDHVGAIDELHRWSHAVVCLPEGERDMLSWLPDSYRYFGLPERPVPHVDHWIGSQVTHLGDLISAAQSGGLDIRVHVTPGHSPGGVCYEIEGRWFVGDTLFNGSVGRIDLPGGDWLTLQDSLRYLATLPDDTVIYPGHGPQTTVGKEKRINPFLRETLEQSTASG